jgi:GNAT superfamily N-acetyltransferase
MTIQIRSAERKDHQFIATSQVAMAFETEQLKLDPIIVEKGVMAVLNDSNKGEYFIAEIDHEPVACLLTIPEWSDWRNGTVLWIHSVYVLPQARKFGVFKALYHHLKDKVQESAYLRGLRLYVDKSNKKAQDVYTKLGMTNHHYELYEWMKTF